MGGFLKSLFLSTLILFSAKIYACDFSCPQNYIPDTLGFYEFLGEKVRNSAYVFSGNYDTVFYRIRDTLPPSAMSDAYVRYYRMGRFAVGEKFKGGFIPDAFAWVEKSACREMEAGSFLCGETDCDWLYEQFPFFGSRLLIFADSVSGDRNPGFGTGVEYYCWDRRALRTWFEIRGDTILYQSEFALLPEFRRLVSRVKASSGPVSYDDFTINVSPNPFHPSNTLFFSRKLRNADLFIFDLAGRYLFKLEKVSGGSVRIDLFNEPAGLYVLRIRMGSAVHNKKVLFFK